MRQHADSASPIDARWWQAVALGVFLLGLALSGPYSFALRRAGTSWLLLPTPMRAAAYWLAWAAAVPMLLAARRIPLDMRRRPSRLGVHIALALAGSAAHAMAFWLIERVGWEIR